MRGCTRASIFARLTTPGACGRQVSQFVMGTPCGRETLNARHGVVESGGVTYRFARFSTNSDTRQLPADGREVHISPKAFELLLMLIEHRSRAVSKAEFQERLWRPAVM